jgi:hypothetical protein
MQIIGHWWQGDDGIARPVIEVNVLGADGTLHSDRFLVDSGADCTALSAAFLERLRLPTRAPVSHQALQGIGGHGDYVLLSTALEFTNDSRGVTRVRGDVVAFVDTSASDMSILGRDVLNNFDLILSRRRNEVLLLAPNHRYVVST